MALTIVEPKGKGVLLLDSHPAGCRKTVEQAAAAVPQASTAIPGISLYVSLLHEVLGKDMQSPITQAVRLWQHLTGSVPLHLDELGRIRLDDWESAPGVQEEVKSRWAAAVSEGEAPAEWFHSEVRRLYGFDVAGVDYAAPTETDQEWPA